MRHFKTLTMLTALACTGVAFADATVTFEDGPEGWSGPTGIGGSTFIDPDGGNPDANMRTQFNDFGITFRNDTTPEFLGDYTKHGTVTLSIDVKVEQLDFFGSAAPRPFMVELRNYDIPAPLPWVSVWHEYTWISVADHGEWTNFTIDIPDTTATEMPEGWNGYGDEDPDTFGPILPEGVTFADVLADVDEIVFSTLEPGWFFGFADFDVRIDNITIVTKGGTTCPADLDENGAVDFTDLLSLLSAWGPCAGCPSDIDGDDEVGFTDLLSLLSAWGPCP